MKRLKVKSINCQFAIRGLTDSGKSNMELFDERVNEFLATMDPGKIYQINYLNSSAGMGDRLNPKSILIATINYFEDFE
jgi:hypothetical protein